MRVDVLDFMIIFCVFACFYLFELIFARLFRFISFIVRKIILVVNLVY